MRSSRFAAGSGVLLVATAALGQTADMKITVPASDAGPAVVRAIDPADPVQRAVAEHQKRRSEIERELRKIRSTFLGSVRNVEMRQMGISKIREYTTPAAFPALLDVFQKDADDVRTAIVDHLASLEQDEADTTLAWAAVFDDHPSFRALAADRLVSRVRKMGECPRTVQSVIAEGLRRRDNDTLAAAAGLADSLSLVRAIPMLINAQLGGGGETASDGRIGNGALAYIMVGKQTTFVSDLQPVVGDSAVGFDPELSVITEGVVLRVIDAAVVEYRMDVHNALTRLSSRAGGVDTTRLGFDQKAWRDWWRDFEPRLTAMEQAQATAAQATAAQADAAQPGTDQAANAQPGSPTPAAPRPGGG